MRLSFSTNAYVRTTVIDAVERIAAAGYGAVELLADTPHLFADEVTEEDVNRLAEVLDTAHLEVANINANTAVGFYGGRFWEPLFEPSIAHPDAALRAWRVAYTRKCVDMARALGCRNVSVTSGKPLPGVSIEKSLEILAGSLRELHDYASPRGVRIGMEYEPGLLVESCAELMELLDRVDCPGFGANLDLGHSHVLGEDAETVISALGERVFHVHLEDIRGRKHYHLIPGEGDLDFAAIFSALKKSGYGGCVTVELYTCPDRPDEAARRALQNLNRYLQPEREIRR